jgi:signal transduction histidine kinase
MAVSGAKMAKSAQSRRNTPESRDQAVVRRLAELVAQRDWKLVQAGRSLHDDLGQILTAAGIQFDLMSQDAAKQYPQIADRIATLLGMLEDCQMRTRVIGQQMSRSTVDRLGLKSALERVRDRWEPGFAGHMSLECPAKTAATPAAARAIVSLVEHSVELACNRLTCTKAQITVKIANERVETEVFLENLMDPLREVEEEVRWQVVRGNCHIAGGESSLEVAAADRNGTILRAYFG